MKILSFIFLIYASIVLAGFAVTNIPTNMTSNMPSTIQFLSYLITFLLTAWWISKTDNIRKKCLSISDLKFNIILILSCFPFYFLTPNFRRILFLLFPPAPTSTLTQPYNFYGMLFFEIIIGLLAYFAQQIFIKTKKMQNDWRLICLFSITFLISSFCSIIFERGIDSLFSPVIATFLPLISLFMAKNVKNKYLNISSRTFYFTIIPLYSAMNAIIPLLILLGSSHYGYFLEFAPIVWEFELAIYLIICFVIFIIKKIINKSSNAQ